MAMAMAMGDPCEQLMGAAAWSRLHVDGEAGRLVGVLIASTFGFRFGFRISSPLLFSSLLCCCSMKGCKIKGAFGL